MIHKATPSDFNFIRKISETPEAKRYLGSADNTELAGYIADPEMDLLIWMHGDKPAGFALFCEIGNPSGRVELRRLGLEKTGAGMGQTFMRALIDHGFDHLKAARIWLDVVADNPRAQATYQRAGFMHEGTLRQSWQPPIGDVADMQIYGMLRAERPV